MHAQLDALLTAIYVLTDDFLPKRRGPGRPPRITDAELITLAIAQVLMGLPNDRQFLALAAYRLGHLFPYLPRQPAYNKRLRGLGPEIERTPGSETSADTTTPPRIWPVIAPPASAIAYRLRARARSAPSRLNWMPVSTCGTISAAPAP